MKRNFKHDGLQFIEYEGSEPGNQHLSIASSPIRLLARSREGDGSGWSVHVEIIDQSGIIHKLSIKRKDLVLDFNSIMSSLFDRGFKFYYNDKRLRDTLHEFLNKDDDLPILTTVKKSGWHRDVFVLGDAVIGANADQYHVELDDVVKSFIVSGTLEDWNKSVAQFCLGNPRLLIALGAAFAGPLLPIFNKQNFGLHLYGPSSVGKTIATRVAASVWSIPKGPGGLIQTWRTTSNGLEASASKHNQVLMVLDEIGELDKDDLSAAVYMLGNGIGKSRANQYGAEAKRRSFELVFLSTGEVTLESMLNATPMGLKAGHEVRLIEIAADAEKGYGLFDEIHQFQDSRSMASFLEQSTQSFYGVAGRAFIDRIIAIGKDEIQKEYLRFQDELSRYGGSKNPQFMRIVESVLFAGFAGELARNLGIVDFEINQFYSAAHSLILSELAERMNSQPGDDQRMIGQIKLFYEKFGHSRISDLTEFMDGDSLQGPRAIEAAGYRTELNGVPLWLIPPGVFQKELLRGYSIKRTISVLFEAGLLVCDSGAHTKVKRVGKTTKRFYAINLEALEKWGHNEFS